MLQGLQYIASHEINIARHEIYIASLGIYFLSTINKNKVPLYHFGSGGTLFLCGECVSEDCLKKRLSEGD